MTALRIPHPTHTLAVMQGILADLLDSLDRSENHIADLESDLRDARNDWASQSATIKLTAAREEQAENIAKAAQTLRTIETMRAQNGMDTSVLGKIIAEFNKESDK